MARSAYVFAILLIVVAVAAGLAGYGAGRASRITVTSTITSYGTVTVTSTTTAYSTVYSTATYTATRYVTVTTSVTETVSAAPLATTTVTLSPSRSEDFELVGNLTFNAPTYNASSATPGFSVIASPFLWNLLYAQGSANLTVRSGVVYVAINFTSFRKVNPSIGVDGYPTLMYGAEWWWPFYGASGMSRPLVLPAPLSSLPEFNSTLGFSVYREAGVVDDFSYDIWLGYVNGTGAWTANSTQVVFPDIEVMVWLYHEATVAGNPYFVPEGQVEVPVVVNGTPVEEAFYVYVLPHTGSATGWIGVYYLSATNLTGNVTVPLSQLIEEAPLYAKRVFGWLDTGDYYLDAIQVGMEFNDVGGRVEAGYTLWNWTLEVRG